MNSISLYGDAECRQVMDTLWDRFTSGKIVEWTGWDWNNGGGFYDYSDDTIGLWYENLGWYFALLHEGEHSIWGNESVATAGAKWCENAYMVPLTPAAVEKSNRDR